MFTSKTVKTLKLTELLSFFRSCEREIENTIANIPATKASKLITALLAIPKNVTRRDKTSILRIIFDFLLIIFGLKLSSFTC